MSTIKPLIIDKREKVKGLTVFCLKCKQSIDARVCKETGKRLSSCKNAEYHAFRASVVVPGTNGSKRKTKVFRTREIEEAIKLKLEFEAELREVGYQKLDSHIIQEEEKPELLIECMSMYLLYLNNVGVDEHRKKVRSRGHINDVDRYFKNICLCLKSNGLDHTIFKIDQFNNKIVAMIHNYLLNDLNYGNKMYNKFMSFCRQWLNWMIEKKGYGIENPFIDVTRRKEPRNNVTINSTEFQQLLKVIKPENGVGVFKTGERKNYYRDWISFAFRLALETGLRREEFVKLRFSDIVENENGQPIYIEAINYKVNRILNNADEEGDKKFIPITKGLLMLLDELGYESKKNSDEYLIAANEKATRKTLILFISKAFSHFWKLTGIEKAVQLKHLRKTYLTALVDKFGDKARFISGHSGIEVMKKHYVNDKQIIEATKDFNVLK